jgi:hypothetical protein
MIRQSLRTVFAAVMLLSSALAGTACATSGRMFVRVGPPAPVVEARVVAPGPGYVWVPGYYAWTGGAYIWRPGVWMRPPHARAVWVQGRWVRERRGWFWAEGHWR